MLAQEIERLNTEAAQIESHADQNARGGSPSGEKTAALVALLQLRDSLLNAARRASR
jgi:hypothetical protein